MKPRVRAILITPHNTALFMKRVRPGHAPYWVFIGGGVEASDPTLEAALQREVREEIAGEAAIVGPFRQFQNPAGEIEYFYLARIAHWNFTDRTGPEFTRTDRGEYLLEEIPLTTNAIAAINLLPPQASQALLHSLAHGHLKAPGEGPILEN
ncbi:NUDIX domain-containing protein [Streptomyces sp. NPDC059819]|uniref:NUDIX hydrolase n=1 Tax=Streptomyces sp. NPDC059819 TaxID=3346963 RepID=UPI0036580CB2